MYLQISTHHYPLLRRVVTDQSVTYYGMTSMPQTNIGGTVTMCRDDGFVMSQDDAESYARQVRYGTILKLTNEPEHEPVEPVPTFEERISALEEELEAAKILLGVMSE